MDIGNVFKVNFFRVWFYIFELMNERIKEGKVYFFDDIFKRLMNKRYLKDFKFKINLILIWIKGFKEKLSGNE